ncbi:epsin N-terminal-likey (ENTH) domain containing protein [Histomonas meleagridis]|uniref:epsin N-terminal-likey (ENTH) domain containing protein n=1 Tax=Histomonas meleagridis TaxID=135588 RepID=UPI0035599677|nr:epsin N-terminal-likey (ENTH) domain containing protein [Histomonas meleagridis]KAH0799066.1 epsin N-terminal-likey (ENTH) domain containing protein [Histomonas meleagridis]
MFTCSRVVDKITSNDDLHPSGMLLAEAVELAQKETTNAKRIISRACEKLDSSFVVVRVKAINLLLHLLNSNVSNVIPEIKHYTDKISNCIGWKGEPHPTRGYDPYNELKDGAQQLLDRIFTTHVSNEHVERFSITDIGHRTDPVHQMESFGNTGEGAEPITERPSLNPINHAEEEEDDEFSPLSMFSKIADVVKTVKEIKKENAPRASISSASLLPEVDDYPIPTEEETLGEAEDKEQRPHGQFTRLENDITFQKSSSGTRNLAVMRKTKTVRAVTPAAKLLLVSKNRSFPTNAELTQFKETCYPDSYPELIEGLSNPDWRVKLRAIAGLDIFGNKYGIGTVAGTKDTIALLAKSAVQSSLKSMASRFYNIIKDVEPVAPPESSFNFGGDGEEEVEDDTQGYKFE